MCSKRQNIGVGDTMQVIWQCEKCYNEFVHTHFSIDILSEEVPRQTCDRCGSRHTQKLKLKQCQCGALFRGVDSELFLITQSRQLSSCPICDTSELEAAWYNILSTDPIDRQIYLDYVLRHTCLKGAQ